jgi:hypothetical protein
LLTEQEQDGGANVASAGPASPAAATPAAPTTPTAETGPTAEAVLAAEAVLCATDAPVLAAAAAFVTPAHRQPRGAALGPAVAATGPTELFMGTHPASLV